MDTLTFLEQLAARTHYRNEINELISLQPDNIQNAFKFNNPRPLKKAISNQELFADKVGVVHY